eukprot:5666592-Alexandrium_andersonii.AAC.1
MVLGLTRREFVVRKAHLVLAGSIPGKGTGKPLRAASARHDESSHPRTRLEAHGLFGSRSCPGPSERGP